MRQPVTPTRPFRLLFTLMVLSVLAVPSFAAGNSVRPDMDFLLTAPDSPATPSQALAMDGWQSLEDPSPNFGYIRKTVWLRFPVPERGDINLLEIGYAHLDHIRFFLLENGEIVSEATAGDRLPFLERPVLYRNFLFRFDHAPEANQQILLEVRTSGAVQVPVHLWHDKDFFESAFFEDLIHAVYYGILITVICFNLFIFIALREKIYLLYVLSTLGYLVIIGSLNGIAYQLLWPANPEIQNRSMVLGIPFAMVFTLWFAHAFLQLRNQSPATARVVSFAIILNTIAAAATFLTDYNTAIRLVVALTIPSCLLLTLLGPQQWLRGNRQAIYYTLAWGALTLGSAVTAANKYGLLPNSFLSVYTMQIGSALQAVLLALAMASRIYQERQDKVLAREAELRALEARRSVELRLMDQALHHPLTGLPNRSSFEMMLNDLIMRHPEKRYGVAVVHLNNLSSVTKTLGHRNTDRILELAALHYNSVVQAIPGAMPVEQTDERNYFLASLDQQSFGFIVEATLAEASPRAVVTGLDSLRQSIDYLGMQVPLDPRMGVAIFPDHGSDANTLIRRAIIAEGSERARDRGMAYYKPSRDAYSADRLTMVSELRKALDDHQLALYLQPKQSLTTGQVVGMEALIRWPGRQKKVSPDEIVLLAEQTGLIKPLTRWVLEESLRLRTQLLEQGWDLELSANISPNNLREADFSLYVQRLMNQYDGHRGAVTFEVTETSMMLDPANSLEALNALNAAGIRVSIDDFGSGYSSLSYIKQLPASEIKIDRSLVTDLPSQAEDRVIVQTTIDMCHNLGYQVVAEGVEDQATADLLRDMGCDMIQGYLVTPPLPVDELLDWLNTNGHQPSRKLG
ncbi:EAL domain-containing protein [Marinobacter pelagius]|uniref:Diguanylate cyclase/phosphodiesterase n=1 Tax=Marinobacter pelagius TaxID=379482 RepID=A0A1I4WSF7_9GAMM|nr:EAL domain-containing protein [Marinobacter pelagius]SFN16113.1 diguanylate cyclase/phosphodiesterase [Marinobacter pelagius]